MPHPPIYKMHTLLSLTPFQAQMYKSVKDTEIVGDTLVNKIYTFEIANSVIKSP